MLYELDMEWIFGDLFAECVFPWKNKLLDVQ
jgi:hypothetical protein